LGGIQLLSISFISEYVAKILEETKNRPKFIIKEIINDNKNKK
jgi:dolichol-phosphate mannosyltransferase